MSEDQLKHLAFSGAQNPQQPPPPAQTQAPSRDYNRQILDTLKSTWKI
jgi:hypothetical protein